MKYIGLIKNLKTHEMERKARKEKAAQKKKTFAFRSTLSISNEEDEITPRGGWIGVIANLTIL